MARSEQPDKGVAESSPGALLRAARLQQDISERELADRLNWQFDYVAAVEEDRFDVIRNPVFVTGYLRAAARLLEVDEEQVIAAYRGLDPSAVDTAPERLDSRPPQVQKTGLGVPVGIAAAVLLVIFVWWFGGDDSEPRQAASASADASTAIDEPALAVVEPRVAESAAQAVVAASDEDAPTSPKLIVSNAAAQSNPSEVVASVPDAVPSPPAVPAATEIRDEVAAVPGELLFRFSDECWVEVRDADGDVLVADLKSAGAVLRVSGRAPFKVLLGNAAAATLNFGDETVEVPRRPGRTTARFTVGEQ